MSRRTIPFERSEPLPGVRLVTERMPHVRSASLGLWVDVGSRDEPGELAGASHLLEHLVFKGTASRNAQQIAEMFDAVGGELNAYADKEHTCLYARVLDEDLPMAAEVLLDMFRHAVLREEDLESERKVVLEEIHMAADMPEDNVHDLFAEWAWHTHPLGRPVIGTAQTVGAIDRQSLHGFYEDAYVPGRLVVAAAGNVRHEDASEFIVAALADAGVKPIERVPQPPVFTAGAARYERRATEQVHLVWGCEGPARRDPDRYALAVLNVLFGGGMSSRLFQEVREKRGLAYSVYSGHQMYLERGLFSVYAGTSEATAPTVLEIVREQASALAGGELGAEEVERAKGQVKGNLVLSMDDPSGRMARLGRAELLNKEILTVDQLLAEVDRVTTEDVGRVAKRLFAQGGFFLASVGAPKEGSLDRFVEPLGA